LANISHKGLFLGLSIGKLLKDALTPRNLKDLIKLLDPKLKRFGKREISIKRFKNINSRNCIKKENN